MVDNDVLTWNTIVCVFGGEAIAEVVVVVDMVCEIGNMPKDALMRSELVINSYVEAVIVVGSRSIREVVIKIAPARPSSIWKRVQVHDCDPNGVERCRDLVCIGCARI